MLDIEAFRVLCQKATEEKDPANLEILKERMRVLLAEIRSNREHYSESLN